MAGAANSPNHDANHLALARKIDDPVTAATTDGRKVTSALRNDYLNRANSYIQMVIWSRGRATEKPVAQEFLSGLVTTSAITFVSVGASVPSDYAYALGCQKDAGPVKLYQVFPVDEITAKIDDITMLNAVFCVRGGRIFAYENGAQLTSGAGTLYYLRNDKKDSAGDDDDINIDTIWHPTLVDIAASFYFEDTGKIPLGSGNEVRKAMILSAIS